MSKITTLALAAIVTLAATGFWLKAGVSETAAGPRQAPAIQMSPSDLQRSVDINALPVQKMDDRTFVFTDPQ